MVEALFHITEPEAFLESLSRTQEITYSEEFFEKYYVFQSKENTSLELRISDEGHSLVGLKRAKGGTETTVFPIQGNNIGNLKDVLTTTLGLLGELHVRQTVYEAGEATFAICKVENQGYFIRLESYNKNGLKALAKLLSLDLKEAYTSSLVCLASEKCLTDK